MQRTPSWFERLLRRTFSYRDIGWKEIGEDFVRFTIVETRWFAILLHRLEAPRLHPQCHDHPWAFVTCILRGGYEEHTDQGVFWRRPGTILYRPATFRHNVVTKGVAWSLILRTARKREWQMMDCGTERK